MPQCPYFKVVSNHLSSVRNNYIPDTNKINLNVDREGVLEFLADFLVSVCSIDGPCKRDLLMIVCG